MIETKILNLKVVVTLILSLPSSTFSTCFLHHHHHQQQQYQCPISNRFNDVRRYNHSLTNSKFQQPPNQFNKRKSSHHTTVCVQKSKNDHNTDNEIIIQQKIIQPLESILTFLSKPLGTSLYSLPLVYPLTIIGFNFLLDDIKSVLILDFSFILFYTFVRSVLVIQGDDGFDDDDGDESLSLTAKNNKILDLIALFGSIVTVGLISPSGLSIKTIIHNDDVAISGIIGFGLLLLCFTSGVMSVLNGTQSQMTQEVGEQEDRNNRRGDKNDNEDDDDSFNLFSEWDRKFKELNDNDS